MGMVGTLIDGKPLICGGFEIDEFSSIMDLRSQVKFSPSKIPKIATA